MDRLNNEALDDHVKRVFGAAAVLGGSIGSERQPGEIRIVLDRRTIGCGPTFRMALQAAQRTAAREYSGGASK